MFDILSVVIVFFSSKLSPSVVTESFLIATKCSTRRSQAKTFCFPIFPVSAAYFTTVFFFPQNQRAPKRVSSSFVKIVVFLCVSECVFFLTEKCVCGNNNWLLASCRTHWLSFLCLLQFAFRLRTLKTDKVNVCQSNFKYIQIDKKWCKLKLPYLQQWPLSAATAPAMARRKETLSCTPPGVLTSWRKFGSDFSAKFMSRIKVCNFYHFFLLKDSNLIFP